MSDQRPTTDVPARDDKIEMWCDLLLANIQAESASYAVTRRAEIYMRAAGLPLERVLNALDIDEPAWLLRVDALRANEAKNRAIHQKRDSGEST